MDRKKLVLIGFLHLVQISLTPRTKTVPPMVTILVAILGIREATKQTSCFKMLCLGMPEKCCRRKSEGGRRREDKEALEPYVSEPEEYCS
jgi:hypothetical protein